MRYFVVNISSVADTGIMEVGSESDFMGYVALYTVGATMNNVAYDKQVGVVEIQGNGWVVTAIHDNTYMTDSDHIRVNKMVKEML